MKYDIIVKLTKGESQFVASATIFCEEEAFNRLPVAKVLTDKISFSSKHNTPNQEYVVGNFHLSHEGREEGIAFLASWKNKVREALDASIKLDKELLDYMEVWVF